MLVQLGFQLVDLPLEGLDLCLHLSSLSEMDLVVSHGLCHLGESLCDGLLSVSLDEGRDLRLNHFFILFITVSSFIICYLLSMIIFYFDRAGIVRFSDRDGASIQVNGLIVTDAAFLDLFILAICVDPL